MSSGGQTVGSKARANQKLMTTSSGPTGMESASMGARGIVTSHVLPPGVVGIIMEVGIAVVGNTVVGGSVGCPGATLGA